MTTTVQLTFDCAAPAALAQFWMTALQVSDHDHYYVTTVDPEGNDFDLR